MTRIFHWFCIWKMDPMLGFDIRFLFTLPPRDSTLQYKRCVHLWNTFLVLVKVNRCCPACTNMYISSFYSMNINRLSMYIVNCNTHLYLCTRTRYTGNTHLHSKDVTLYIYVHYTIIQLYSVYICTISKHTHSCPWFLAVGKWVKILDV